MIRSLSTLSLLALGTCAFADRTFEYSFEIAGAPAGSGATTVRDDGTFSGTTDLDLGQKIKASFSGTTKGQAVPNLELILEVGKQKLLFKRNEAGATLSQDGKTFRPIGAKTAGLPIFAVYAPFLNRTLVHGAGDGEKPLPPSYDYLLLDNFSPGKLAGILTKSRKVGEKTVQVGRTKVAGAIEIDVAFDEAGEFVGADVPAQSFRIVVKGFEGVFADPMAKHPELSPVKFETETVTASVPAPLGATLATTLVRPKAPGKYPTILIRTPYGRVPATYGYAWFARRGYVVMVQDCRGRGDSTGKWDPFVNEIEDGKATLDWITQQPWSDGKVGMIGGSYGGYVQWAAAVTRHPALRCIIPQVSPPATAMRNLPYLDGVPLLLSSLWWLRIVETKNADMTQYAAGLPNPKGLLTLPLSKADDATFGKNIAMWSTWLRRDSREKWKGWNFQPQLAQVSIPVLHISGYWDGDEIGTMLNYRTLANAGHREQSLIYGPWPHSFNTSTTYGGVDFGEKSVLEIDPIYLRFFDAHLKGRDVLWSDQPPVRVFLTGANRWIEGESWPLPSARPAALFLSDTELTSGPKGKPVRYTYDPSKVVVPKELFGKVLDLEGSLTVDPKSFPKARAIYKTPKLKGALRMAGPITLDLTFATSALSTDFIAAVYDEAPDGKLRSLGIGGAVRAGFIDGDRPGKLTPNAVSNARVRIWDFAHEFKTGHRAVLVVTSDGFPGFARNLGTGDPVLTGTKMRVQRNTIYGDAVRPSVLRFYKLP